MNKVAGSILGIDNKIKIVNNLISNNINQIHYDVMDGKFVSNISLPISEVFEIINNTKKHITDVHLMTENPEYQIEKLDGKVDYITFHIEASNDIDKLFKNRKSKIGISIKPNTSVNSIKKYLNQVSHVLVMSVEPGHGGQKFMPSCLNKIKDLKKIKPDIIVQVDGGINDITSKQCFEAGADSVVSGSFLIKNLSPNILKKII